MTDEDGGLSVHRQFSVRPTGSLSAALAVGIWVSPGAELERLRAYVAHVAIPTLRMRLPLAA
jgi:hypothetical protein